MTALPDDDAGRRRVRRARRRLGRGLPIDEAPEGLDHDAVDRLTDGDWPYEDDDGEEPIAEGGAQRWNGRRIR